jgi:MiaB-like tRNA modifying enzyme
MKAYFESYGCALSYGESEMIMQLALERGWELTHELEEADLAVISTCIVVQATEAKMSHRIKELVRSRKPLVVFGCMASAMADKVKRLAPTAMLVPPNQMKALGQVFERCGPERPGPGTKGVMHGNIPISNGCLGNCTYCITKKARGDLRSRPLEDILDHVRSVLGFGRKEIRLTAQDTALYGRDQRGLGLPGLVDRITAIDVDFRIRIGMMNPSSLAKIIGPLLESYRDPKVYKFLHLPLQSGSDDILGPMGRGYKVKDYIKALGDFRRAFPDLYVSTDIIAGFPGETDEDFRRTIQVLEQVRPGIINIKAFSARPGTKAKRMAGRIDTKVVKSRTRELTALRKDISRRELEAFIGRTVPVLLTERPKKGTTMGRTPEYRPIAIKGEHELGQTVDVRMTRAKHSYLLGEIER